MFQTCMHTADVHFTPGVGYFARSTVEGCVTVALSHKGATEPKRIAKKYKL